MSKNEINPNLVIAVGALALVFVGGKKVFEALGLVKSKDEKERELEFKKDQQQLAAGDYFDPDYYKKFSGAKILTVAAAQSYCKLIHESKGFFNDDEAKVYGVFQALKYKTQVSWLAAVFFAMYKQSLLAYLLSFLNDSEMQTVAKITNKLPNS